MDRKIDATRKRGVFLSTNIVYGIQENNHMNKDVKLHFYKNLDYLCKANQISINDLKVELGIKGAIKSLESFIKICNFFDVIADDILFTTLKDTTK